MGNSVEKDGNIKLIPILYIDNGHLMNKKMFFYFTRIWEINGLS